MILSQIFPTTWPQMQFDLVLKSCQSVLRTLFFVPLVFVFVFGSAKIAVSVIGIPRPRFRDKICENDLRR